MDSNPLLQSIAAQVAPKSQPAGGSAAGAPALQFSLPCFEVDFQPGKAPSIQYLFYELPFPQLPHDLDFKVANGWVGAAAGQDLKQEVKILGPDGAVLVASGLQPLQFPDANTPHMVVTKFTKVTFSKPGLYPIVTYLNGREMLRYPLTVRTAGQGS